MNAKESAIYVRRPSLISILFRSFYVFKLFLLEFVSETDGSSIYQQCQSKSVWALTPKRLIKQTNKGK